jgi:small multidrug resistance pump
MRKWLVLVGAVALEVTATLALRAAVDSSWWMVLTVAGYAGAFVALSALLRMGVPIGVVYGIWAAAGVALTAIGARVFFKDALTKRMAAGVALVAAGVLIIELGATVH